MRTFILTLLTTILVIVLITCPAESVAEEKTLILVLKKSSDNLDLDSNLSQNQKLNDNSNDQDIAKILMPGNRLCLNAEKPRHRRHHHKNGCACRRLMCPVCGSDGVSYANLCYLACAKAKKPDLAAVYGGRCNE